ncbi:MAG TPA: tetratricopeptide repeat protein, partial [Chroococcales cyanobacterium]
MPRFLWFLLCLTLWAAGAAAEPISRQDAPPRVSSKQNQWWDQLQEADALVNQGDWPRATTKLQALLFQVPPPVRAMIHLRLASIFANQEDWVKAIQNGKLAIQSSPSNGWVYLPVAKILHAAGKPREAVATCRAALKADPAVKDAAQDLIAEINDNGLPPWGILAGGVLALSGGGAFLFWRRKKNKKEVILPARSNDYSLPNYYPITGHAYNPGDLIGHYRILSVVGSTLHSILYCALDPHLDRKVALKQVNPGIGIKGDAPIMRFQKEVKSLIALSNHHAGVVKVYDFIEPGMLVMEWVDGQTLEEAWGSLGVDRVLEIGIELCNILDFAHSMAIVHRDIKPSNIMLTNQTHQIR